MKYRCDNCRYLESEEKFPLAVHLSMRLWAGSEATDRECPDCGALAYPVLEGQSPSDWVCPECGSDQVKAQVWIDCNTHEVMCETGGYYWCSACENEGGEDERKRICRRSKFDASREPE